MLHYHLCLSTTYLRNVTTTTKQMTTYEWILERRATIKARDDAEIARLAGHTNTTATGGSHIQMAAVTTMTTSSVPLPPPTNGNGSNDNKEAWSRQPNNNTINGYDHGSHHIPHEVKIHSSEDTTSTPVIIASSSSLRAEGQPLTSVYNNASNGVTHTGSSGSYPPLTPSENHAISPRSMHAVSLHGVQGIPGNNHASSYHGSINGGSGQGGPTGGVVSSTDPHRTPSPSLVSPSTPLQHAVGAGAAVGIGGSDARGSFTNGHSIGVAATFINALPPLHDHDGHDNNVTKSSSVDLPSLSSTTAATRQPLVVDSFVSSAPQSSPKLRASALMRVHSLNDHHHHNKNDDTTNVISIHHDKAPSLPGMMDEPSSPARSNPPALDITTTATVQSASLISDNNDANKVTDSSTVSDGTIKGMGHHSNNSDALHIDDTAPLSPSSAHLRSVSVNRSNNNDNNTAFNILHSSTTSSSSSSSTAAPLSSSSTGTITIHNDSESVSNSIANATMSVNVSNDVNTTAATATAAPSANMTSDNGNVSPRSMSRDTSRRVARQSLTSSLSSTVGTNSNGPSAAPSGGVGPINRASGPLPPVQLPASRRYTPGQPLTTPSSILRPLSTSLPLAQSPAYDPL
jgi:hypothetical protein